MTHLSWLAKGPERKDKSQGPKKLKGKRRANKETPGIKSGQCVSTYILEWNLGSVAD